MNFDDFLRTISPKVGPKNAFDLARDTRYQALEKILVSKLGITQEDIDQAMEEELQKLADNILKMPPLPNK